MKTSLNNTAHLSKCDNTSCDTSLTQPYSDQSLSPGRRLTGWFFASLALLACPCHFAFWIMLFSGTALGSFLSADTVTAVMVFSVIFLISLTAALLAFNKIKL
ncbi:MerE protein [Methylomonas methanica]|uniref:MerE protein n=2 Tax=Methylococcaceae TaxID=403 RepID=A0ABY2CMQ2_METMH|nr:MerE protein [Methylomonas methanica]